MKDELRGQIMEEFAGLRAKTCSYLKVNHDEDKKAKDTKKCVIKRELKFQDYNNCLKAGTKEKTRNYLEKKIRINVDSLKGDQKEFEKKYY